MFVIVALTASCLAGSPADQGAEPDGRIVQTIPPATLTAISAQAAASQTPAPGGLDLPWSALDGLVLDFWYVWDLDEPGTGMNAIVDRFNAENEWGITVQAVDQGLVLDPSAAVDEALSEGLVPHLMAGDSSALPGWYDQGLLIDLTRFIDDPAVGMPEEEQNAFYSGIWEDFTLAGDERPGLPFTQSIQVIYYNETWARELGFTYHPLGSEDFHRQSCAPDGEDGTAGTIFSPQANNILSFIYAYGGTIYDPEQDAFQFSSPEIKQLARDWRTLYQDGCGALIANYPNPMAVEQEFTRFNSREALMIMGPAQMMGHIHTGPNQTGRADEWAMLPFLGPDDTKAVVSELQSLVIFQSTPEEELASWLFLKYLLSPEIQAEWVQYSYLYPTRADSLWHLREFRQQNPHWAEGLNLLKYGRTAPLHPAWITIQLALEDAFEDIIAQPELTPNQLLLALDQLAAELLERAE